MVCVPHAQYTLAHSSPHPTQSTNTCSTSSSTNGQSHSASSRPPAGASNLRAAVLNANSVKGKCPELHSAALGDATNPDILIITETKIDSSVSASEFLPKSHTAFRKDCTYHSGGVLVAVRNTFTTQEVCIECEFICIKVTLWILNPCMWQPSTDPTRSSWQPGWPGEGLRPSHGHLEPQH